MCSEIKQVRSPSRKARGDRDFKAGSKIRSEERYPTTQRQQSIVMYISESGAVSAEYEYDPFGKVIAHTGRDFDFLFSTKFYDPDIDMYYYGYRYYSPELRRWASPDPIGEAGGLNLYAMCGNALILRFDILGRKGSSIVIESLGAGWAGTQVTLNGNTAVQLNGEPYYLTLKEKAGMYIPKNGSTSTLFLYKAGKPAKALRLDYHELPPGSNVPPEWHINVDGGSGIAKVANSSSLDHTTSAKIRGTGKIITVFKHKKSQNICFIAGIGMSLIDIYKADNKTRESARQVGGWAGAYAGGRIGSSIGARAGMTIAIAVGQAGPQITTPEELLTVPVFGVIGGISGGIVGSVSGFFFGATATEKIHDWIFTPLEKEEWEIACEK